MVAPPAERLKSAPDSGSVSSVRLPTTPSRPPLAALAVVAVCLTGSGALAAFDADAIDTAARVLPRLHSLIVSRRGEVIFERYYNKAQAARPANVKSASKSVIAALVGIAIDRKLHRRRAHAVWRPVSGTGQGRRPAQAGDHGGGPARDALGARGHQRPRTTAPG